LEREAELATIGASIGAAVAGDGRALAIEGEAGLGKTRLVSEAVGLASAAGAEVLSARAGELERDFPFAVLRQLLAPRLRQASAGARKVLFEGADPALGALGLPGADDSSTDTFSVLHALYWVLAGLSEERPLLLAIDDAHLADAASLDWLAFLLPRLAELPVAVVLARRTGEGEGPSLARVVGDPSVEIVRPASLSSEATSTLIEEALQQEPDPAFAMTCHEITGGNPFLLTELGRELVDQGIDPRAGSIDAARGLAPERVAQTVRARISRLTSEASALARAVAVLGDGCELSLAVKLAGIDREGGRQTADALRRAAILDPGGSLGFIHPLVRNAVYADIATSERAAMHATAAALLREIGSAPERVAVQLLAGEPREDPAAAETLLEAGRRALADGAPRSAVAFLIRALQEPPPAEERLDVLRPLLTAGIRAPDHEALVAIEPELRAAIERDPAGTRDLAIELPLALMLSGRYEEAGRLLSGSARIAADEGDIENAFKLDALLRGITLALPSIGPVDLERYFDEVEPDSPAGRLAAAIEARAGVMRLSRSTAAKAARRALSNDCSLFEEEPEMMSATACVFILALTEEVDAATKGAERALEIARKRGSAAEIGRAWFLRAVISSWSGDLAAAESDLRQAREIATLAAIAPLSSTCAGALALIQIWRDELDAAEATLADLGVAYGPMPTGPLFLLPLIARATLRFERAEYAPSLEDIETVAAHAKEMGIGPGASVGLAIQEARALVALGRADEARRRANLWLLIGRIWRVPVTLSVMLRVAAAAAEGAEEIKLLEESVDVSMGSPARIYAAEARVDLGTALRRQNQRAAARAPLREGLRIARRCGAIRLAKRAHEELQATGETVRRYAPIGVGSLTPSERRVAEMAAGGMTNRQIAQSLFVTLKTVEAHLSAAYDKLDIRSRRELPGALPGSSSTN